MLRPELRDLVHSSIDSLLNYKLLGFDFVDCFYKVMNYIYDSIANEFL